jgi:hypothetical protein
MPSQFAQQGPAFDSRIYPPIRRGTCLAFSRQYRFLGTSDAEGRK